MRKNVKKIAASMAAALLACSLVGCGGGDSQPGSQKQDASSGAGTSNETVNLTLWGAEEDQDLLKELVDKFEAAHSDQKFNIEIGVESESTAKDTIMTDIEAAADVYAFASDQITDLVRAGALANLDEVGDALSLADKTLDDVKSANSEASVEAASVDGSMYAFPMAGDNSYFLFYDSSVISEEDAKTWDGLLKAAKKAGKKVGFTMSSGWYNAAFFYGAGFTTGLNEDGTTTIDWNGTSADGHTGVEVVQAMLDITSNPAFMAMADGSAPNHISSGDLCAVVSGTWDATTVKEQYGDGYAATKLPTYTLGDEQVQMAPAFGYKFIGVNAYSKQVGWAAVLAEFLTNEESQATRFAEREIGPTNLNVLDTDDVKENIAIAAVTSEADFGVIQSVGAKYWDPVATLGEMIAQGELSANDKDGIQKALDTAVEGVTAAVE